MRMNSRDFSVIFYKVMSSMSDSDALQLLFFTQRLLSYSVYVTFALGTIGNFICILIFASLKLFRHHRCSFYLIIDCICSTLILSSYFVHEILNLSIGLESGLVVIIWCKMRLALSELFRLIVCSMVCFQAIDQYCSTHHRYVVRQIFTLKLGKSLTILTSLLWIGQSIPFFIYDDMVPYTGCLVLNKPLNDYFSFFYHPILQGILPIFIASIFSLLAYRNVRQIVRRQIPIERRRLDQQFTAMIFARVLLFVVFSIPYTIYRIIILNFQVSLKDLYPFAVSQLILIIVAFFINVVYVVSQRTHLE